VALLAFIVNLGMGLHQFAWRNNGLNALRPDLNDKTPAQKQPQQKPKSLLKQASSVYAKLVPPSTHAQQ
jgi:hypothetical protein